MQGRTRAAGGGDRSRSRCWRRLSGRGPAAAQGMTRYRSAAPARSSRWPRLAPRHRVSPSRSRSLPDPSALAACKPDQPGSLQAASSQSRSGGAGREPQPGSFVARAESSLTSARYGVRGRPASVRRSRRRRGHGCMQTTCGPPCTRGAFVRAFRRVLENGFGLASHRSPGTEREPSSEGRLPEYQASHSRANKKADQDQRKLMRSRPRPQSHADSS